jgi:hypothetical protein
MDSKKLLKYIALLILFIFLLNFLANQFYWYYTIWYFDIIMHFLGGYWVGLLAAYLFAWDAPTAPSVLKILGFVLLVGVGWEFFEIFSDKIASVNYFFLSDTLSDILFDFLGGTGALLFLFKKIMMSRLFKVQSS